MYIFVQIFKVILLSEHLEPNDRYMIIKEINKEILEGNPHRKGKTDCDKQEWQRILEMDELTIYDNQENVKEKRWYERRAYCSKCSTKDIYYSMITNGKERLCQNCGLKEKVRKR